MKGRWRLMVILVVALATTGAVLAQSTPPGDGVVSSAATGSGPAEISLWSTIKAGGWIGLLIILMSIAALSLTIEHFMSIRRERFLPPALLPVLDEQFRAKRYDEARQTCISNPSLLATVVGAGLTQIGSMFGFFDMQNAMQEASERRISELYRKLEYLSFIAATAPMLGLLGTVTGMISAFNQIAVTEGSAKPSQLAGGISEALVTTCMGLILAIPVMFLVSHFRNRIDSYVGEMESVVEKLMGRFRQGKA